MVSSRNQGGGFIKASRGMLALAAPVQKARWSKSAWRNLAVPWPHFILSLHGRTYETSSLPVDCLCELALKPRRLGPALRFECY